MVESCNVGSEFSITRDLPYLGIEAAGSFFLVFSGLAPDAPSEGFSSFLPNSGNECNMETCWRVGVTGY